MNFLNSPTQLATVESGAAIRKGPFTPISIMCAITEMHWMVLPNPISSARIPFTPFSYNTCTRERRNLILVQYTVIWWLFKQPGSRLKSHTIIAVYIRWNSFISESNTQQYSTEQHFRSTWAFISLDKNLYSKYVPQVSGIIQSYTGWSNIKP